MQLGDAFRRLDDLCDAFEDLDARAWSSLWLDVAYRDVDLLYETGRPRSAELLEELRKSRVADAVASRVVDGLAARERVEAEEMLSWACSWVAH